LKDKLDRMAKKLRNCFHWEFLPTRLREEEQAVRWLLAQLLSWHRREDKRAWQDAIDTRR